MSSDNIFGTTSSTSRPKVARSFDPDAALASIPSVPKVKTFGKAPKLSATPRSAYVPVAAEPVWQYEAPAPAPVAAPASLEADRMREIQREVVAAQEADRARRLDADARLYEDMEERAVIAALQAEAVGMPAAPAPAVAPLVPAPAAIEPKKKGPSLRSFVNTDVEFEGSEWTNDRISEGLASEAWRMRDADETMKEGDLICYLFDKDTGVYRYERMQSLKDTVLTQEMMELHTMSVYTLEGGGKKKAPPHGKTTADFASMSAVPKGMQLKLPTDETEARRFFGTDVLSVDLFAAGKQIKAFYPILSQFADRAFRSTFSRIFVDFARKHLKDSKCIPNRGDGVRTKRGCSIKYLLRLAQDMERPSIGAICDKLSDQIKAENDPERHRKLKARLATYQNMDDRTIEGLLARADYQPKSAVRAPGPILPFLKRMENRPLTPAEFKYDKAIGIEIETGCKVSMEEAAKRIPMFVRTTGDASLSGFDKGITPIEFRILVKRSELEARVLKAIEALDKLGAHVNLTCGMHVHFDMRDKTKEEAVRIAERLQKWVRVLWELVPKARRENKYCIFEGDMQQHRCAVSTMSYDKHKTIEVRAHSGTLCHTKIIQWVRLMETLMQMSYPPLKGTSTLDGLKMLPLSEADRTYWLKRHQHLNKELYQKDGKTLKVDTSFLSKPNEVE